MPVEGHEIFRGKIRGDGYGQREDKGVPVGGEGLTRIADVRDARHIGGEDAHAHYPARDAVTCRGELVGAAALLEERTAEHHHAQREHDEYNEIYYVHCLFFLTTDFAESTDYQLDS